MEDTGCDSSVSGLISEDTTPSESRLSLGYWRSLFDVSDLKFGRQLKDCLLPFLSSTQSVNTFEPDMYSIIWIPLTVSFSLFALSSLDGSLDGSFRGSFDGSFRGSFDGSLNAVLVYLSIGAISVAVSKIDGCSVFRTSSLFSYMSPLMVFMIVSVCLSKVLIVKLCALFIWFWVYYRVSKSHGVSKKSSIISSLGFTCTAIIMRLNCV